MQRPLSHAKATLSHASATRQLCVEVMKLPGATRRSLAPGQALATSEQRQAYHVVVERGAVVVRIANRVATWSFVEILGGGSCVSFGHNEWGAQGERWTVTALLPTAVLLAPSDEFFRALSSNAALASAAAIAKAQQHAALLRHLATLRIRQPLRRVAGTLLYLADVLGETCPLGAGLQLPLSQEIIASVAHLSRQTVNRELRRLHNSRKVYSARGMVCCLTADGLRAIALGSAGLRRNSCPPSCKFLKPQAPLDCASPHEARR